MRKLVSPSLRKLLTEQGTVPMLATRLFAMERHRTRRAALFAGTFLSAVVLGLVMQAHAEPTEFCDKVSEDCEPALRGGVLDNSVVGTEFVGENTEQGYDAPVSLPLWITVDGVPLEIEGLETAPQTSEDRQRIEDLRLEAVDIQVRFDGLDVEPTLNVSTRPAERLVAPESDVEFFGSWNFPAWLAEREVRTIDEPGDLDAAFPL